jgi:RNA polymerase sigma-70 factor (ECF subfamily)
MTHVQAAANPSSSSPAPTPTDEEIVARVRAGEAALFELIMRRYNARLYRAARAILRSDSEAEDVMQDAYVRAYAHLHEFEGRARFSTWLTRIAVHEALARVRRARRLQPIDAENHEAHPMSTPSRCSPEQQASDGEIRVALERAVDSLPDDFRTVFVLRAVEEMSGAETAECLGIPEETVKTRLFRARVRLQEALLEALEPVARETFAFHRARCDRVVAGVFARIAE